MDFNYRFLYLIGAPETVQFGGGVVARLAQKGAITNSDGLGGIL